MHSALLAAFLINVLAQTEAPPDPESPSQFEVQAFICVIPDVPRPGEDHVSTGVWDGSGVSDEGFTVRDGDLVYDEIAGITILSEPSLVTVEGEEAEITVGGPGTDFLEPVPGQEGVFRVIHIDEGPTVALACTVEPKESGYLEVALELDITRLTRREQLEGLNLDVGRPVFAKQQLAGSTLIRPGHWLIHRLYVTENTDECVLFLLRVEHYSSQKGA